MRRPKHATVVAYLALFVALGGSSYAALNVTGRDVVDRSLTGRDVRQATLTSRHVRDGSLQMRDFRAGQVPAGPAGPAGPVGSSGPKGDKGDKGDPGEPPATAFAIVRADGSLVAGRGVVLTQLFDPVFGGPAYAVAFARDVRQCAVDISVVDTAQINDFSAIPPGSGAALFQADNAYPNTNPGVASSILARITDASGTVIQSPFQVSVMC